MIEKINVFNKNNCKNKIAAIVDLRFGISFNNNSINNYLINNYYNYLKDICNYEKIYIVINKKLKDNLKEKYNNFLIIDDMELNLFIKYNINDIYLYNIDDNFYGGIIPDNSIYNLNRLLEFYKFNKNNDNKIIYIHDNPRFYNPYYVIQNMVKRIFDSKSLKIKNNLNDENFLESELKLLQSNRNLIQECFESIIVGFCGIDYNKFFENLKINKRPIFNSYDCFNCFIYNGVNEIIEEKLKDYCFENKKYNAEYHGYKKDIERIRYIESCYSDLKTKFMFITRNYSFFENLKENEDFDLFNQLNYYDLIPFISSNCKSTLITHDNIIIGNQITPRYFDGMLSDLIAFIDIRFDPEKKLVNNKLLKDFIYISSPNEFSKKVEKISNDKLFYKQIKLLQRKAVFEKFKEYIKKENIKKYEDCFKRMQLNIDNKNWNNDIKNNFNIEISDNDNIDDLF